MGIKLGIAPINWSNDDDPLLGGDISLERCLSEMQQSGYIGCELGHKFPRDPEELVPLLKKYQLQVTTDWIGTKFTETDGFDRTIEEFCLNLDFYQKMGIKALKVCECGHSIQNSLSPLFAKHPTFSEVMWQQLFRGLHRMGELAKERGMYLAYHPHLGTGVENEAELIRLLQGTDPELVTLLPDTGHLFASGTDPLRIIAEYYPRIRYLHLKDVRVGVRDRCISQSLCFMDCVRQGLFTVPGDGAIDFRPILKLLQRRQFKGWLIVEAEQDPDQANPLTYAQKAHAYLTSILEVST